MAMRRNTSLVRLSGKALIPLPFVGLLLPVLVLLGTVVCYATPGADEWSKVSKAFQQALLSGNVDALEKAAEAVALDNKTRALELLVKGMRSAGASSYWVIVGGLGKMSSEEALSALGDEIIVGKQPEIRRDLIMSLRLSESPSAPLILRRILRDGAPDLQVSAIDELVDRLDVESVPELLQLAEKDPQFQKELTRRVYGALRSLAKEDPKGAPSEWRAWWAGLGGVRPDVSPAKNLKPGVVGQTVVESLRPARSTRFEDLKKGEKGHILVMTGEYDSVQDVLVKLELPHITTSFAALKASKERSFQNAAAVLLNCDAIGDWPEGLVRQVRDFVAQGGYLFVSDLGVPHLIRHAFPGYMQFKAGNHSAQNVTILPARGTTGHAFMRGVDLSRKSGAQLQWQVDEGGPALHFDEKKVVSLIEAPELMQKRKPPSVAVTFSYGREVKGATEVQYGGVYEERELVQGGTVLCVLSHFKKQQQSEDGFALQNLLLNFLIEARDRQLMREDAKGKKK